MLARSIRVRQFTQFGRGAFCSRPTAKAYGLGASDRSGHENHFDEACFCGQSDKMTGVNPNPWPAMPSRIGMQLFPPGEWRNRYGRVTKLEWPAITTLPQHFISGSSVVVIGCHTND